MRTKAKPKRTKPTAYTSATTQHGNVAGIDRDPTRAELAAAPLLKDVLRSFYMLVHPDRFVANHKEAGELNEESFQKFSAFITQLKSRPLQEAIERGEAPDQKDVYPEAATLQLRFYTLNKSVNGAPETVSPQTLVLRTTGGNCQTLVAQTLVRFFHECGIEKSLFRWGPEFWQQQTLDAEYASKFNEELKVARQQKRDGVDRDDAVDVDDTAGQTR